MGWDRGHEDTIHESGGSMVSMSLSTVGLGCQAQMCSLGGDKPHFAEPYLFNVVLGFQVLNILKQDFFIQKVFPRGKFCISEN